ncbi:WG repeat-containing protein [Bacteroides sp. OttesenSCG-928-E20]|nr:WG repeat-containing protein [Bacteroides sp. OttesenSCG-928-E20]
MPLKYDYVQSFTSRNIAGVNSNGKWGIVDSEGRELISPKYNWIKAFDHSDLLVATLDGVKYGFIDKNDRQIIPFDYTIESTSDYGWIVSIYDENSYSYDDYKPKYVFISYEGAISSTFDRIAAGYSSEAGQHIIPFSEGLTWVQNQEIYDLRDTKMKSVKSFQLSEARQFSDGLAAVKSENKKWAYVNKKGKFVTPNLNYDNVGEFVEGLAPVYSGEKIGFINRKGVEVSPCIYDYPPISDCDAIWYLNFRNGLAAVCKKVKNDWAGGYDEKNYKWGFINNKGEEVVPCVIDVIGGCDYDFPFIAKRILATIDGEYCFIKKTGQVINKNFSSTTNILSYIKQLIGIKKQTGNINVNYDEVYSRNNYRSSSTSKNIVMNFEIEYENGIPKRTIYQNNIGLTEYNNLDLFTNFITIPEGKMWIFKRAIHMDKFSGGSIEWAPHLLFYPNGKGGRYQKLNLSERGKGLILNSGDEFRIKLRKPAGGDGIITFELCFLEQFE